jgi:hypothetical protein
MALSGREKTPDPRCTSVVVIRRSMDERRTHPTRPFFTNQPLTDR